MKTPCPVLLLLVMAMLFTSALPPVMAQDAGSLDDLDASVAGARVFSMAAQPDGKIIIVGAFTSVQGVPRNSVARLHADGSLDMGFDPNANSDVLTVAVQADGKILIGGNFTTLQPNGAPGATARQRVARVNADGSLDMGFDPKAGSSVVCVVMQPDGKILLGGGFNTLQPNGAVSTTTRQFVARVNADGSLDTGFYPKPNTPVNCLAVQADGKILIGGIFTTLQPNGAAAATARQYFARVNADGSLDTGFDPMPDAQIANVAVQADGKILIGGRFTTLQPNGATAATMRQYAARIHADGTLDMGFDLMPSNRVQSMAVQADGKILLGGLFTTLQPNGAAVTTPRSYLARVNADGSLDMGFNPRPNGQVLGIQVQSDGQILLGGTFTTLFPNGAASATARVYLARLNNDAAAQTLSATDGTQAVWTRGGASPEVSMVTFEQSIDGGVNWTPLGSGMRMGTTSNWQLAGLALPAAGQLRGRGFTSGGYGNGGAGLVEQVISLGPDSDDDGLLDSWEELYWPGGTALHGPLDDDDHDGLVNLLEMGFGLNPTLPNGSAVPAAVEEGGYLTMTITKQAGVAYEVQSAGTLPDSFSAAGTTVLINDATTLKVRDNVPMSTPGGRFLRVRVTAAP